MTDDEKREASAHPMLRLSLREGAVLTEDISGAIAFEGAAIRIRFGRVEAATRDALLSLRVGVDERAIANATEQLVRFLERLASRDLLAATVSVGATRLATLAPITPALLGPLARASNESFRLSRFALARVEDGAFLVESPRSRARVVLHDPRAAALLHALATPRSIGHLAERSGLAADAVHRLVALLRDAGALHDDGDLATWEFHDLYFHTRTRNGRHDYPVGGTYRFFGTLPPPPARAPRHEAPRNEAPTGEATREEQLRPDDASSGKPRTIALFRPDLEAVKKTDPPFSHVFESRASLRTYGERPLTDRQLGEFLYRTARVTERFDAEVEAPQGRISMEFVKCPYPSGGGLYELEIYPVVASCEGIAPGLYRYDPVEHQLVVVADKNPDVDRLLRYASDSTGTPPENLNVLFVLAARFDRIAWKYASVAYALILKNVGVMFQSMYLVATAMGLAPTALGGGDADVFARAAGTDYYRETSVGEFLLGSRA